VEAAEIVDLAVVADNAARDPVETAILPPEGGADRGAILRRARSTALRKRERGSI